jgi:HTH-type transcriptional regulator / antitoxin HigA
MEIGPITSKDDYKQLLKVADDLFDKKVAVNSIQGKKLQSVLLLIKQYEDKNFPIPDIHRGYSKQ